jgi:hypothetical protein
MPEHPETIKRSGPSWIQQAAPGALSRQEKTAI